MEHRSRSRRGAAERSRRRWAVRLALAALALPIGTLHAHEGVHHVHPGPQAAAMDEEERVYYLELFARVVRDCAFDNHDELLDAVDQLVNNSLDSAAARKLYGALLARMPMLQVRWDGAALQLEDSPAIEVAMGIPRAILVEVLNEDGGAHSFAAEFQGWRRSNVASVPAGAKRGLLAKLVAVDPEAEYVELVVSADADAGRVLVPVEVVQPATLVGHVFDAESGRPTAARVFARGGDGELRHAREFRDNETLSRKKVPGSSVRQQMLPFFYTDGHFTIDLPPGVEIEIRVERGFEHDVALRTLELAPGERREVTIESRRFIDMPSRGWISADTHVHWVNRDWSRNEDLELLSMVQRAEDLHVVSNLTLRRALPSGRIVTMPDHAPMGTVLEFSAADYLVQMAEEYRNDPFYGHLILLNITSLVQPIATGDLLHPCAEDFPINYTVVDEALTHEPPESRPAIIVAHGIRGSAPVDIATGRVDSIDQCTATDYYDLLDCGMRLPLTNGSDHPSQTVGWGRCYVRIDGPLTYGAWIDGILRGDTFQTSGPLLFLTVNGAEVGREIDVASGAMLDVHVEARARSAIGRLEVVSNRQVLFSDTFEERAVSVDFQVPADVSRWLTARCSSTPEPAYTNERNAAHTSAIYVKVDGAEIFNDSGAAQRLRDWCQRGGDDVFARGTFYPPHAQLKREQARDYFYAGRDIYQALIDRR